MSGPDGGVLGGLIDVHSNLHSALTLNVSIAHVDHTFTLKPGLNRVARALWVAWAAENVDYPPVKSFALWAAIADEPVSLQAAWRAHFLARPLPTPRTPPPPPQKKKT